MTDRELMQQALNALESCADNGLEMWFDEHLVYDVITALRDRLAQTEQEPVAWRIRCTDPLKDWVLMYLYPKVEEKYLNMEIQPLYTTPPQRKPLTLEQQDAIVRQASENDWHDYELIMAVEAAHGIKGKA